MHMQRYAPARRRSTPHARRNRRRSGTRPAPSGVTHPPRVCRTDRARAPAGAGARALARVWRGGAWCGRVEGAAGWCWRGNGRPLSPSAGAAEAGGAAGVPRRLQGAVCGAMRQCGWSVEKNAKAKGMSPSHRLGTACAGINPARRIRTSEGLGRSEAGGRGGDKAGGEARKADPDDPCSQLPTPSMWVLAGAPPAPPRSAGSAPTSRLAAYRDR